MGVHGAVLKQGIWNVASWDFDGTWSAKETDMDLIEIQEPIPLELNTTNPFIGYYVNISESKIQEMSDFNFEQFKDIKEKYESRMVFESLSDAVRVLSSI